jgi:hypothetical protein
MGDDQEEATSDAEGEEAGQENVQAQNRASGGFVAPGTRSHGRRAGADPTTQASEIDRDEGELVALGFGVNRSLRYHAKRRAFLDTLHRLSMLLATIGGSGTFVAALGKAGLADIMLQVFAAIVALAVAFDRVFNLSEAARTHDNLYRRFSDLATKMDAAEHVTVTLLHAWKSERRRIEKDEPAALSVLNIMCHNQEVIAGGYDPVELYRLHWWQTLFAQVISLPPYFWLKSGRT